MELSGLSAIVTGGGSGMGAATAKCLASHGVKIAIFDRDLPKAKAVAAEIGGQAFECDVQNEMSVKAALNSAAEVHGIARILVNCAGIAPAARIVGREAPHSLQDFSNVISINLIGTFNVMRLAAQAMVSLEPIGDAGERGVIINTASIAAYEGQIGQAAYSASKGGVVAMTLPAAREFAKWGIRVNAIAPGLIETPMLLAMPAEVQQSLAETVPFPHRLGKPEEFAFLVEHLIQNPMINGEVIRLDGALRMSPK